MCWRLSLYVLEAATLCMQVDLPQSHGQQGKGHAGGGGLCRVCGKSWPVRRKGRGGKEGRLSGTASNFIAEVAGARYAWLMSYLTCCKAAGCAVARRWRVYARRATHGGAARLCACVSSKWCQYSLRALGHQLLVITRMLSAANRVTTNLMAERSRACPPPGTERWGTSPTPSAGCARRGVQCFSRRGDSSRCCCSCWPSRYVLAWCHRDSAGGERADSLAVRRVVASRADSCRAQLLFRHCPVGLGLKFRASVLSAAATRCSRSRTGCAASLRATRRAAGSS